MFIYNLHYHYSAYIYIYIRQALNTSASIETYNSAVSAYIITI